MHPDRRSQPQASPSVPPATHAGNYFFIRILSATVSARRGFPESRLRFLPPRAVFPPTFTSPSNTTFSVPVRATPAQFKINRPIP